MSSESRFQFDGTITIKLQACWVDIPSNPCVTLKGAEERLRSEMVANLHSMAVRRDFNCLNSPFDVTLEGKLVDTHHDEELTVKEQCHAGAKTDRPSADA